MEGEGERKLLHVLMRDEEERRKQGQINNKARQHSTPKHVHVHGYVKEVCLSYI